MVRRTSAMVVCALFALNTMGCSSIRAGGRKLFGSSPNCAAAAAPTPECPDPEAARRQARREELQSRRSGASVARGFSIASIVIGSTVLVGGVLLSAAIASSSEPCTASDSFDLSAGKFRSMDDDFDFDGDGGSSCGPGGAIAFGVTSGLVGVILITLGAVGVVKMNNRIREIDKQLKVTLKPGPGSAGLILATEF